jgi:cytoplasmic tRNA 2-thiolation protein 2
MEKLKNIFPLHKYQTLSLHEAIEEPHNLESCNLSLDPITNNSSSMLDILPKLSSSSRMDIVLIQRTRLIIRTARSLGCTSIAWGDSTTRLAERVLTETAKGRGFGLPQLIGESSSRDGVDNIYPNRDLLRRELDDYLHTVVPQLKDVAAGEGNASGAEAQSAPAISSKDMAIEQLIDQYFTTVEQNYPSIVANVVRTSTRLFPQVSETGKQECSVCGLYFPQGRNGVQIWGGDQAVRNRKDGKALEPDSSAPRNLCYGCTRSLDTVVC